MGVLRVIGGSARGRRLRDVPGDTTRPITDRAKESLFNIIGGDIDGATMLDLFGGTGSVGIEALSRGADFVRFIDLNRQAVETIKANLATACVAGQAQVLKGDAFHHIQAAADRSFDYVFIAPPQYKEMWKKALQIFDQRPDWLAQDAWVIVQIHPVEYTALALERLEEFDQRSYGSVLFVFYQPTA